MAPAFVSIVREYPGCRTRIQGFTGSDPWRPSGILRQSSRRVRHRVDPWGLHRRRPQRPLPPTTHLRSQNRDGSWRSGDPPGRSPTSGRKVCPAAPPTRPAPGPSTSSPSSPSTRTGSARSSPSSGSSRSATPSSPIRACPRRSPPTPSTTRTRSAAFVDAVRWGAVTSADANAYQAPFRSGANVEAYQLEPLRRALQRTPYQPAARRRRRPRQDHRGRPGHPGAAAAPPGPNRRHRLPAQPVAQVAGRDAREVRAGLRHRQQRAHGRGAPQPRPRTPTRSGCSPASSSPWRGSAAAGPATPPGRLRRGREATTRHGATRSTSSSSTKPTTLPPPARATLGGGRGYAVDSQRTRHSRPGRDAASTGSSSARPRTTGTRSLSRRCSR